MMSRRTRRRSCSKLGQTDPEEDPSDHWITSLDPKHNISAGGEVEEELGGGAGLEQETLHQAKLRLLEEAEQTSPQYATGRP